MIKAGTLGCVFIDNETHSSGQLNALQASPVVHLVTPLSCVSLSMNTQPSVPIIETNKFFRKLFALPFLPQEHIVEAFQVNISIIEIRILCINVLTRIAVFHNDTYFQSAAIVKWGQIHSDCIKISDIITTWRGITCKIAITIEGVENAYLTRNVHFQYRP